MADGLHSCCSVKLVSDEDSLACATEPLGVRYTTCIDGKPVALAYGIKLSKISNILISIVLLATGFTGNVQYAFNYPQEYQEDSLMNSVDNLF